MWSVTCVSVLNVTVNIMKLGKEKKSGVKRGFFFANTWNSFDCVFGKKKLGLSIQNAYAYLTSHGPISEQ